MKALYRVSLITLALVLAACVTINIYFPEAAAAKVAGETIEEIYGKKPLKEDNSSWFISPEKDTKAVIVTLVEFLIPAAQAQDNLTVNSEAANQLKTSMKARHENLLPFYVSGAVGLGNDGYLQVKDIAAASPRDRATVKQLVAAENQDRSAFYREIARLNGNTDWEARIREAFAKQWIEKADKGWWYQDAQGAWQQR